MSGAASAVALLEPLREPAAIDWWPPAPGWWILGALLLAATVYGAYTLWRYYRRGACLRDAKKLLNAMERDCDSPQQLAYGIAALHRRLALALGDRRACAGLTGDAWSAHLNDLSRDKGNYFTGELLALPHRKEAPAHEYAQLLSTTKHWINALDRPA